MSEEIQVYNANVQVFTIEERECFLALQGKKIRDHSTIELEDELNKIIQTTFFNSGQKLSAEDAIPMLDSMIPDLKNYFNGMTIEEIKVAFKRGLMKEFGDYFGLNPVTFLNWLKNYMTSANRSSVKTKLKTQEEKVLSDQEKEELNLKGVIRCWNDFKEKRIIYDFGNATYNYLERKGIINFNKQRKNEIKADVKKRLIESEAFRSEGSKSMKERRDFKGIIDRLKSETGEQKDILIFECRREALKIYFSELLEMGEELETILNEKR